MTRAYPDADAARAHLSEVLLRTGQEDRDAFRELYTLTSATLFGITHRICGNAHAGAPGHYDLTMQWDLDHKGNFDGTANGRTITFIRNDIPETLRPTDGDATGLKYLAGKTDCLTVKPGEGYCRDGLSR